MSTEKDIKSLFIIDEDVGTQTAEDLARRALKFGRVAKDGSVIIDDNKLSKIDQLKLALAIRFIAHSLDENISRTVRPFELTRALGQRIEAVGSGLSKLYAEGFAKKEGAGMYSIQPYKIDAYLREIETSKKSSDGNFVQFFSFTQQKKNKTQHRSSGAGADIQRLIDDGFFELPKFVSDVVKKLKEENAFHDDRVVDKIMRETFVSSRRTLKRIPNEGSGKAKWQYVIRK